MAILNWLVQGSIVAALTAVMLRCLEKGRAQSRYTLCWIALVTVLALPLVAAVQMTVAPVATFAIAVAPPEPLMSAPRDWWSRLSLSAALVLFGAAWSAVRGVQLAAALLSLRRARQRCRPFPRPLEPRLHHWTGVKERGRRAQLMLSDDVRAAAVLSGRVPIIAVASSVVDQLTAEELDCLVIHEWAHVQRRDDAAHFAQVICRTLAGWHPAVWWLSRRLHEEREAACDEMAVARTGSAKAYAASLVKLAALPHGAVRPLPAVGALSSSSLAARVRRIISQRRFASDRWSRNAVASSAIVLAATTLAVAALRIVETAAASSPSDDPASATHPHSAVAAVVPPPINVPSSRRLDDSSSRQPVVSSGRRLVVSLGRRLVVSLSRPEAVQAPQESSPRHARPERAERVEGATPAAVAAAPALDASPDHSAAASSGASLPAVAAPVSMASLPAPAQPARDTEPVPPWIAAANAGRAVGQGSRTAGVATAGFFTRFGKRIAGSF